MAACMQFVLSVEVTRLGTYAMLPNSFLTPRSLIPYNEVRTLPRLPVLSTCPVTVLLLDILSPYLALMLEVCATGSQRR